jgi:putative spermidine/putrescine transport system ATP-binding protein
MSKVEMANIEKSFGRTHALRDFSLTIPEGSLISLLGPSGCGKTTALRILAGLITADSGKTFFDSSDITDTPSAARDIGMVFQAYSLFPNMSARQNVEFGLKVRKVATSEIKKRVDDILEITGLAIHQEKYPHQLSGGQQQRTALARAIVIRPRILLLDEPLSALDAQVRDQLRDEIRRVQLEFGITTLFVTHDQEEAMTISDQVGVMHQGSLMQLDVPQRVYDNPENPLVARFIGAMNEIPAVVAGSSAIVLGQRLEISQKSEYSRAVGQNFALVRPEFIELDAENGEGEEGTIGQVAFLGPTSRIHVTLHSGTKIIVVLPSAQAFNFSPQQRVRVSIRTSSVLVSD